jgi:hypothetical protein
MINRQQRSNSIEGGGGQVPPVTTSRDYSNILSNKRRTSLSKQQPQQQSDKGIIDDDVHLVRIKYASYEFEDEKIEKAFFEYRMMTGYGVDEMLFYAISVFGIAEFIGVAVALDHTNFVFQMPFLYTAIIAAIGGMGIRIARKKANVYPQIVFWWRIVFILIISILWQVLQRNAIIHEVLDFGSSQHMFTVWTVIVVLGMSYGQLDSMCLYAVISILNFCTVPRLIHTAKYNILYVICSTFFVGFVTLLINRHFEYLQRSDFVYRLKFKTDKANFRVEIFDSSGLFYKNQAVEKPPSRRNSVSQVQRKKEVVILHAKSTEDQSIASSLSLQMKRVSQYEFQDLDLLVMRSLVSNTYSERVISMIQKSNIVIAIFSNFSISSKIFRDAIDHAYEKGKSIFVVIIGDFRKENIPSGLKMTLLHSQYAKLVGEDLNQLDKISRFLIEGFMVKAPKKTKKGARVKLKNSSSGKLPNQLPKLRASNEDLENERKKNHDRANRISLIEALDLEIVTRKRLDKSSGNLSSFKESFSQSDLRIHTNLELQKGRDNTMISPTASEFGIFGEDYFEEDYKNNLFEEKFQSNHEDTVNVSEVFNDSVRSYPIPLGGLNGVQKSPISIKEEGDGTELKELHPVLESGNLGSSDLDLENLKTYHRESKKGSGSLMQIDKSVLSELEEKDVNFEEVGMNYMNLKFMHRDLEECYLEYKESKFLSHIKLISAASLIFLLFHSILYVSVYSRSQYFTEIFLCLLFLSVLTSLFVYLFNIPAIFQIFSKITWLPYFVSLVIIYTVNMNFVSFNLEIMYANLFSSVFIAIVLFRPSTTQSLLQSVTYLIIIGVYSFKDLSSFDSYRSSTTIAMYILEAIFALVCIFFIARKLEYEYRVKFLYEQRLSLERVVVKPVYPSKKDFLKSISSKGSLFISYSHSDKEFAMRLEKSLTEMHFSVWIDTKIKPGEFWRDQIVDALDKSSAVIFVISPASARSKYCMEELNYGKSILSL